MIFIDYLGRQILVYYDFQTPELDTNYPGDIHVRKVEYDGRNITRLIDLDKIELLLWEEHYYELD